MSQAPSPLPSPPAQGRRSGRRRLRQIVVPEPVPSPEVPEVSGRRSLANVRRSRRRPLLTFALGLGLGFALGQQHLFTPGSSLALIQQAQRGLSGLLHPLGLAQQPVLVLGSDVVSGSTDVMFAVRVGDGITRVTQIPRDTYVQTPSDGVLKANAVYGILGPDAATKTASELTTLPIHKYLKVNLQAVTRVADALGGVDVDVPKRMYYTDNAQGLYIDLYPGPQTLKGEALEGFLRFRNDEAGDLGRMERQRLVINEVFRKLAQPATLTRLPSLLKIAGEDVQTNLSPLEITRLITSLPQTRLSTTRLPGHEYWENDLSYWMPEASGQKPTPTP